MPISGIIERRITMNIYRNSNTICDKFGSWIDSNGDPQQRFLHDTGEEVLVDGEWLPVYTTPEGEEIWG